MSGGMIRLGAPGDLRHYLLKDYHLYTSSNANPFAARINTDEKYGDLEDWSEWVMRDWQAGVGLKDPEAGGFLYGETETRFREKMFLSAPVQLSAFTDVLDGLFTYASEETEATIPIGTTQTIQKIASKSSGLGSSYTYYGAWVFLQNEGISVTVELRDSDETGTLKASGTVTTRTDTPGYYWYYVTWTPVTYTATGGNIALVTYPTTGATTINLPVKASVAAITPRTYNGTSWANSTYHYYRTVDLSGVKMGTAGTNTIGTSIILFNGSIYASFYTKLYKYGGSDSWTLVTTLAAAITSMEVFAGKLYIALGNSTAMQIMTTAESFSSAGVNRNILYQWDGLLYGSNANNLYYFDDVSWSIAIDVGPSDYSIRGIAGAASNLYAVTDEALWFIAPGDIAVGIQQWDETDTVNGVNMCALDGSLYIPLRRRLVRFDPSGDVLDIWIERGEELPARRIGDIKSLCGLEGLLIATVNPTVATDPPTVWAWNHQGWHHIATLHPGMGVGFAYHDRASHKLFFCTEAGYVAYIKIPQNTLNPLNDSTYVYRPMGWVETGKFYGGPVELDKDWESVYVTGLNLAMGVAHVHVYWQDDESTNWELLGTADANGQELRWSDYTTRPASRWIKLGILLHTFNRTITPVLEAIRVKFQVNVTDRTIYQVSIPVQDSQEMVDLTLNTQTMAQMIAHLDALIKQVPPVIFEDVNGTTQQEVKVTAWSRTLERHEWYGGAPKLMWLYNLTLTQVTAANYA